MKTLQESARPLGDVLSPLVNWVKDKADKFDPKNNKVTTKSGDVIEYDYMVVAAGLQLNYDKISGLLKASAIPKGAVCSIYSPKYVNRVHEAMQNFHSGNAIFTFPGKITRRTKENLLHNRTLSEKEQEASWRKNLLQYFSGCNFRCETKKNHNVTSKYLRHTLTDKKILIKFENRGTGGKMGRRRLYSN
jgi:hypothetical protein